MIGFRLRRGTVTSVPKRKRPGTLVTVPLQPLFSRKELGLCGAVVKNCKRWGLCRRSAKRILSATKPAAPSLPSAESDP
jgi:hypothetical protein